MFIDRDPYYYTRRIKEAIHTRLHSDNINRDGGVEILEAWMPTIRKKHNNKRDNGSLREQISETARKCPWKMYFPGAFKHPNISHSMTPSSEIRKTRINRTQDILAKN